MLQLSGSLFVSILLWMKFLVFILYMLCAHAKPCENHGRFLLCKWLLCRELRTKKLTYSLRSSISAYFWAIFSAILSIVRSKGNLYVHHGIFSTILPQFCFPPTARSSIKPVFFRACCSSLCYHRPFCSLARNFDCFYSRRPPFFIAIDIIIVPLGC